MPPKTEDLEIDSDEEITVAEEAASKAQRIVAAYAADAEECRVLLDMLGIGPTPPVEV